MTATAAARSATKGRPIPGPRGHPILGSIRDIQRDNIQAFMDAWHEYGDIVHFRGPLTINLLVHPDYVQHVLRDNYKNYPRPTFVADKLKSIVGEGLVAAESERWAHARRNSQPAFHPDLVDQSARIFSDSTAEMLEGWERKAENGEPFDIKSEMMHLTLTNLGKALFKANWEQQVNAVEPIVALALAHTHKRLTSPVDPQRFPFKSTKAFNAGLASLDRIIFGVIEERRGAADGSTDLVSILLQVRDETGRGLTDAEVRDEVIGFFIAGHETVSSALSWTWYLLSKNPESWRRLREEVETVLGGRTPTHEDVPKLEYTTRVLLESMRLFPPIFVLMRCAKEDDEIGGYHVPAGSNIVLCAYVTHRHTDFWDNPEGFDPDRFTPERASGLHRLAYYPFSGGPRKCIGNTFAMVQMPIVLAMVAQRFTVNLVPGERPVPEPAISLRPRDPLMVTLERSGASSVAAQDHAHA
jgi:cytochrome P450